MQPASSAVNPAVQAAVTIRQILTTLTSLIALESLLHSLMVDWFLPLEGLVDLAEWPGIPRQANRVNTA